MMARPVKEEKRNEVLRVRVTPAEKEILEQRVRKYGYKNLSEYARDMLLQRYF